MFSPSPTPIGLFYGSSTCYTEMAAERIAQALAPRPVQLHNVADTPLVEMALYERLILGIPTWDYGELQEDWETHWGELGSLDLSRCTVALFGLGDQVGYPEWFLDAMGYLHIAVTERGARVVGHWKAAGYEFEASKALNDRGDHFVGLALDEENQSELTDERIARWCAQLVEEFDASA